MADPITVDFEGFAKGRPLLAGVLVEREFRQFAFTDVEPGIAMAARACGLQCTDFEGFCIASSTSRGSRGSRSPPTATTGRSRPCCGVFSCNPPTTRGSAG